MVAETKTPSQSADTRLAVPLPLIEEKTSAKSLDELLTGARFFAKVREAGSSFSFALLAPPKGYFGMRLTQTVEDSKLEALIGNSKAYMEGQVLGIVVVRPTEHGWPVKPTKKDIEMLFRLNRNSPKNRDALLIIASHEISREGTQVEDPQVKSLFIKDVRGFPKRISDSYIEDLIAEIDIEVSRDKIERIFKSFDFKPKYIDISTVANKTSKDEVADYLRKAF